MQSPSFKMLQAQFYTYLSWMIFSEQRVGSVSTMQLFAQSSFPVGWRELMGGKKNIWVEIQEVMHKQLLTTPNQCPTSLPSSRRVRIPTHSKVLLHDVTGMECPFGHFKSSCPNSVLSQLLGPSLSMYLALYTTLLCSNYKHR